MYLASLARYREADMRRWKLEDAKNGFSEVVRRAMASEPQLVTRNGRPAVVVVSAREYERLTSPQDLVTFLRDSPLAEALDGGDLKLDRSADYGRDIEI
jgi:prevent-host-death family protein